MADPEKFQNYSYRARGFAKKLRKKYTYTEKIMWNMLRHDATGFRFLRQKPLGSFIADFYCPRLQLAMEMNPDWLGGRGWSMSNKFFSYFFLCYSDCILYSMSDLVYIFSQMIVADTQIISYKAGQTLQMPQKDALIIFVPSGTIEYDNRRAVGLVDEIRKSSTPLEMYEDSLSFASLLGGKK